ncbi:MAG: BtrH N-terminal domain-containing protein [Candidatus Kapaibacterium sp.]
MKSRGNMNHVIDGFVPESGLHCITASIKQVFHYHGLRISEEMIFGLSSMLGFMYFDYKNMPTPMIGGRGKIGEMEENLAIRLGIKIESRETASTKKAYDRLKELIESGEPVVVYADMYYLPYFEFPEEFHFGGHSIVVFGINEDENLALVSDRDGEGHPVTLNENETPRDYHKIQLDSLAKARGSKEKPYPPKNRWLEFDLAGVRPVDRDMIFEAIVEDAHGFLNPPIKNLGIKGIEHFAQRIFDWNEFDDRALRAAAFNAFIMINERGGTGGGCFRRMYGNFLAESGEKLNSEFLRSAGKSYLRISETWDQIGDKLHEMASTANRGLTADISETLNLIHIKEKELMTQLLEYVKSNPCCK